jgi:hypothetical protein
VDPFEIRAPHGNYVLFDSVEQAEEFQAAVHRCLGFPRPGVAVGGGIHVSLREAGWTHGYSILRHASSPKWAHLVDDAIAPLIRRRRLPPCGGPARPLGRDWASAIETPFAARPQGALLKTFLTASPRLPRSAVGAKLLETGRLLSPEQSEQLGNEQNAFLGLTPRLFELAVADILLAQRCAVFVGPGSKDGGVDIVACSLRDVTPSILLVQCKCHQKKPVGEQMVKGLLADVLRYNATSGLLVTTADFTGPARALAAEFGWRLTLWSLGDVYTHFRAHVIEGHP